MCVCKSDNKYSVYLYACTSVYIAEILMYIYAPMFMYVHISVCTCVCKYAHISICMPISLCWFQYQQSQTIDIIYC